jgi:sugar phosphate isomerase/epimerase
MTEADWLACDDPSDMLDFLGGSASERKLRLFATACCRAVWHLLPDKRSRRAVEVAERYADELAGERERATARTAALGPAAGRTRLVAPAAAWAAYWAASRNAAESTRSAAEAAAEAAAREAAHATAAPADKAPAWDAAHAAALAGQARLLRDLFNPFGPAAADPAWLAWRGGAVPQLARAIYEEGHFRDLPVLADALEEAGCHDEVILSHCLRPGEHVRGCWVLDLLLGKE